MGQQRQPPSVSFSSGAKGGGVSFGSLNDSFKGACARDSFVAGVVFIAMFIGGMLKIRYTSPQLLSHKAGANLHDAILAPALAGSPLLGPKMALSLLKKKI